MPHSTARLASILMVAARHAGPALTATGGPDPFGVDEAVADPAAAATLHEGLVRAVQHRLVHHLRLHEEAHAVAERDGVPDACAQRQPGLERRIPFVGVQHLAQLFALLIKTQEI